MADSASSSCLCEGFGAVSSAKLTSTPHEGSRRNDQIANLVTAAISQRIYADRSRQAGGLMSASPSTSGLCHTSSEEASGLRSASGPTTTAKKEAPDCSGASFVVCSRCSCRLLVRDVDRRVLR